MPLSVLSTQLFQLSHAKLSGGTHSKLQNQIRATFVWQLFGDSTTESSYFLVLDRMSPQLRPKPCRGSRSWVDVAETKTGNTFAPQSVNLTLCGLGYVRMNVEEAQVCESLDRMPWHRHLVSGCGHEGPVCQISVGNKLIVLLQVCCVVAQQPLCTYQ